MAPPKPNLTDEKKKRIRSFYKKLVKLAHIPFKYAFDERWKKARPSFLKSATAYNDSRYVRLKESEQMAWFNKLVKMPKDFLDKPYFIAVLGDHFNEAAYKVGMGIACHGIKNGKRVRAFHASELRWDQNNKLAQPTDAVGEVIPYDMVVLHGIHTDDVQMRRQLTRDFFLTYKNAVRVIVLYGEDPLTHLHLRLGLNPQLIFYFPAKARIWHEEVVTI